LIEVSNEEPVFGDAATPSLTRTTYSELPYARKSAAVKNVWVLCPVTGVPNLLTRSVSDDTKTGVFVGPQAKMPAIAPVVVDTAGTTEVRSISDTLIPGLN
jgi:hypothetical protein